MKVFLTIGLVIFISSSVWSQERVLPGLLYDPGEVVYGPIYGITATIPQGWAGRLPQDLEIFLLLPIESVEGQIYVAAAKETIKDIKKRWLKGAELSPGLFAKIKGDIIEKENFMSAEFYFTNKSRFSAYSEALCSETGTCIVTMLIAGDQHYQQLKFGVTEFIESVTLSEPTMENVYGDFNWSKFLGNKYLVSSNNFRSKKERNDLYLCANGTFKSNYKKGSLYNSTGKYWGKLTGNWLVNGVGNKSVLMLQFDNAAEAKIPLSIDEDKVYLRGERFFLMQYLDCK